MFVYNSADGPILAQPVYQLDCNLRSAGDHLSAKILLETVEIFIKATGYGLQIDSLEIHLRRGAEIGVEV